MIVEEYEAAVQAPTAVAQAVILLSARTVVQLQQRAIDLLDFIRKEAASVDVIEMAYTLQVGREAMEERLGMVVSSVQQLAEKLEAYIAGQHDIEDAYEGQVKRNQEALSLFSRDVDLQQAVHKWMANRKVPKLLELWVKGLDLDWSELYGEVKPRRISLPAYPFAKERYWIETIPAGPAAAGSGGIKELHPLLHRNTSDLSEQRYSSAFTGEEFFLTGCTLPWVAYLEMARAAIEQASPKQLEPGILELHNNVWAQPIVVAGNKQVHIALLASDKEEIEYEIYSQEGVHGQGRAVWSHEPAPTPLALEQLRGQMERGQLEPNSMYAGSAQMGIVHGPTFHAITAIHQGRDQLLARLRLPEAVETGHDAYVLHPSLMDSALQACVGLMDGRTRLPFALERLRIVSRCTREMVAWVRYAEGRQAGDELLKLNVDLCDERGNVCVQMRGIRWRPADSVEPVVRNKEIRISLVGVKRKKPTDIVLPAPTTFASANPVQQPSLSRAAITLSNTTLPPAWSVAPAESSVQLYDDGHGIFSIQISGNRPARGVIADLLQALARVQQESSLKALLLSGLELGFPNGEREAYNEAVAQGLYRALVSFPYPVIAVVEGNAMGAGLLAAALCDFMVCSEEASYGYTDAQHPVYPTRGEANLFSERFGAVQAQDLLYGASIATGKQLRAKGWTCPIVPGAEVEGYARKLASTLAMKSQVSLGLLKQHLIRDLSGLVKALKQVEAGAVEDPSGTAGKVVVVENMVADLARIRQAGEVAAAWEEKEETPERLVLVPTTIALQSKVVTAAAHPEGIVVVKMEDREAKNMFSEALLEGMTEVLSHIEQTPGYKVVILTGYDSYFASGGTKEGLLAIQAGQMKFTDHKLFQWALDCKLPVIAAMQGHGIGAGWTLGMFADVVLLSEESRYVSPYMNYGFTPGAGATYILANKMGHDLARESLLTGEPFTGRELKQRGLQLRVLPRAEVYGAAMALARQMAQASRSRLMGLKHQWTGHVQQVLEETYRLELAMHEKTFVDQPDTLAQIHKNFYPEMETSSAIVPPVEEVLDSDGLPAVTASLKTLLANELQMRESDVEENVQFVDLGLDSISGVSWVRKINEKYDTSIEAAQLYSHATLSELSRYVKQEAERQGTLPKPDVPRVLEMPIASAKSASKLDAKKLTSRRRGAASRFASSTPAAVSSTDAIAVIGMAGQFPQAKNLEEFWQNVAQGRNCITQVPANRWDINAYYQPGEAVAGKSNSQWVGALEDYDRFDPLFFNISPTEAESMDPQQRLFLQACWQSIEDAGYDARVLSGSKCGVFVGCTTGDYHQLSRQHQLSAQGFTGGAMSILAARISYFLNLQGPCISIDTACSSSLVAMAHACDSLRSGASNLALAGGVSVMAGPDLHIMTSQAGMLSPQGKCFTFDQRADGFVPGEGVGVVVLKRLAEAEKDGDMIYAVIQGWGVNQDGRTNGITAPNPESQTRLEQEVYDKYRIDPASIQLIEAHGTGTKLGDPIEVEGLKKAFARYTQNKEYCALGSVKSNIGHCMMAAGIAGAIKLVLALKHKQLPPTINFEQLNEHIGLRDSPFYVNSRLQHWELKGAKRRLAAISSFGFSGTNAHMVLGEYLPPPVVRPPVTKAIIPLSAKTAIQLQQRARDLLDFIRKQAASVDLVEMAYTLQVGREPMEERLGLVVSSVEELAEKLEAYIADKPDIKDFYQGQVRSGKESISVIGHDDEVKETLVNKWIAQNKLPKLLELWVKGLELDWSKLYGEVKPRRMSLPVYPFAKDRYWIEAPAGGPVAADKVLHPQLHRTTSNLSEQMHGFSTRVPRQEMSAAQGPVIGSLLAVPVWQASGAKASVEDIECAEHDLVLCELSQVNVEQLKLLLPHIQCLVLEAGREKDIAQRYSEYAQECFAWIGAILRGKPQDRVLFQIVVAHHEETVLLAGLTGLLKTAGLENPQLLGQVILVPSDITTEELGRHLEQEKRVGGEDGLIRYEAGERQVLSWQEVAEEEEKMPTVFQDQGAYLITGGLGGLGVVFAKEILEQTRKARVVLTGRSALSAEKQARLEGLPAGRVSYRQVDVCDLEQIEQLILAIREEYGQLTGILHSAGMVADNFIVKKVTGEYSEVLAPKVKGTYNLDEASRDVGLDFFVLFSSIAGVLGNVGQADYASANGFMDQFAGYRNRKVAAKQRHGRTRSINWGLWQAGGMGIDAASQELMQQTTGLQPMQTATGLKAFHRSLALPYDQVLVVEGDLPKIATYLQKAGIFNPPSDTATGDPYQYINKAEEFYSETTSRASSEFKEEYLTFAPFEKKKPGFSMSRFFLAPENHADEAAYVLARQIQMRQVLFCREDFEQLTSVLDIGCGHGTDVIQIGALFPHLQAHGYTITRDQAILGNQRISAYNSAASRTKIHHKDSSQDPFPSQYDLVFGIEVSFHIRNKVGLFSNICNSLNEDGRILLADYVSNLQGSVDDPNVEISIPTQREWARLTSLFHLEIDEIIDVSPEISNFLYDPDAKDNIKQLSEIYQKTLTNYANQSSSLDRGWLSYVLIKLKRNLHWSQGQIESHNLARLQDPTPYAVALKAMLRQPRVFYPPRYASSNDPSFENRVTGTGQDQLHRRVLNEPARPLPNNLSNAEAHASQATFDQLQQQLKTILATVLRLPTSIIDADKPFAELGLDSFLGVETIVAINKKYGTELSNIKLFDYPTVKEFSLFLEREIKKLPGYSLPVAAAPAAGSLLPMAPSYPILQKRIHLDQSARTTTRNQTPDDKIAIIGMSGRYPQASNLQQYWDNLVESRNCIVEVPSFRWDINRYYHPDPSRRDKTNSKWLGALDDIDCFDPLFFRISPQEAEFMDPQDRLFLQESYKAFEDAGYSGDTLNNKKCGVYLGISTNEYELRFRHNGVLTPSVTSNSHAIAAARIAYHLNLKGPAISVDTACSSSLVAIHLACQALLTRETDMGLAGGVSLWLIPESYLGMSQAGMLSSVGQCKAFDDTADGIVLGEGVGALVLKRLRDAQEDNDFIYGVILGSGINQDGRTNGITAPSVNSQIELERDIYARYKIDPETISLVEAHGTGTKLGDPIELEALATVFKERTNRTSFCALGSVKSNIGHTSSAAGVAGVQKVLLSMRHRTLVPTLNVSKENSHCDFKNSPFYISREKQAWDVAPRSLRRAAVSAFGFSGTNAHLVIEEYLPPPAEQAVPSSENKTVIVPLSARTVEQLRQRARDLLEFIRAASSQPVDLVAVAYTLQIGREPMQERLGFVVSSVTQLAEKLSTYINDDKDIEEIYQGHVEPGDQGVAIIGRDDDMQEAINKWIARKKLAKLLDFWVRGLTFDWNKLYGEVKPRRTSLPTYPFAKEHYWIEEVPLIQDPDIQLKADRAMKSIEDLINSIGDDAIETDEAVKALKLLV